MNLTYVNPGTIIVASSWGNVGSELTSCVPCDDLVANVRQALACLCIGLAVIDNGWEISKHFSLEQSERPVDQNIKGAIGKI